MPSGSGAHSLIRNPDHVWWIEHICSCWLHNLGVALGKKKKLDRACFQPKMHLHICNRFHHFPDAPIFRVRAIILPTSYARQFFLFGRLQSIRTRRRYKRAGWLAGWQADTSHTALSETCCANKNVFRITTTDFDSIKFISNEKCSPWVEQMLRIRLALARRNAHSASTHGEKTLRIEYEKQEMKSKIFRFFSFALLFDRIVFGIIYCFPLGNARIQKYEHFLCIGE